MECIFRFIKEDDGVTAVEYGLIIGLIAIVIIGALTLIGTSLNSVFENIASFI